MSRPCWPPRSPGSAEPSGPGRSRWPWRGAGPWAPAGHSPARPAPARERRSRCSAERAREIAGQADIVVTNHALLAIDALDNGQVLPEHDVVIIDEAHDLVDRVTSVATAELSAPAVDAAARRCGRQVTEDAAGRLREAGQGLEQILAGASAGRIDVLTEHLAVALAAVRG